MKTFTVYQLQGPNYRDARFDLGFGKARGVDPVALSEKLFNQRSYQLVADIKAVDLNHVFQIGNIGPEENITRIGQMCSLSVGDVIQCQSLIIFFPELVIFRFINLYTVIMYSNSFNHIVVLNPSHSFD